jgi:hypothetical protein
VLAVLFMRVSEIVAWSKSRGAWDAMCIDTGWSILRAGIAWQQDGLIPASSEDIEEV